jgi:hypothetical protein
MEMSAKKYEREGIDGLYEQSIASRSVLRMGHAQWMRWKQLQPADLWAEVDWPAEAQGGLSLVNGKFALRKVKALCRLILFSCTEMLGHGVSLACVVSGKRHARWFLKKESGTLSSSRQDGGSMTVQKGLVRALFIVDTGERARVLARGLNLRSVRTLHEVLQRQSLSALAGVSWEAVCDKLRSGSTFHSTICVCWGQTSKCEYCESLEKMRLNTRWTEVYAEAGAGRTLHSMRS